MQKKVWYYEKWVERHASFPPRLSVKKCRNSIFNKKKNRNHYLDYVAVVVLVAAVDTVHSECGP